MEDSAAENSFWFTSSGAACTLHVLQARNHDCTTSTTKHTVLHHALLSRVADIDVGGGNENAL